MLLLERNGRQQGFSITIPLLPKEKVREKRRDLVRVIVEELLGC
jgi:hypothetical protein